MMLKKPLVNLGENILDKYKVKLLSTAYCNLDAIYNYISLQLQAEQATLDLIEKLEDAILSLEIMPQRGTKRLVGAYATRGYRQLFVGDFTIVYRIDEVKKQVIIVTIRFSKSKF